ncbi:transcription initiation factor IIB-like [Teleopsis dalmanni]|uniref:transcription initiation factor IIB-like n=1 Tax=Teleopsis dalmanni TaxID=139649 RepID=UPI0018CFE322|nr:transcription initiation factor IIB-like [Teleopsis dalmanni]
MNKTKALITGKNWIKKIARELNSPEAVVNSSFSALIKLIHLNLYGVKTKLIAAAIVFYCHRSKNVPISFKEAAEKCKLNKKHLRLRYNKICSVLGEQTFVEPIDYIPRFCEALGLTQADTVAASKLCVRAKDVMDQSQTVRAAVSIWAIIEKNEIQVLLEDVSKVCGVSVKNLTKHYNLLYPTFEHLFNTPQTIE